MGGLIRGFTTSGGSGVSLIQTRMENPLLPGFRFRTIVPAMRFFAAIGVLVGFAAVMAAGMVMTVLGNPWLLLTSLGVFALLFARVGCREH